MNNSHCIEINGHRLVGVVFRGTPYVIASQLATALGYEDQRALSQAISRDWAAEFESGEDFVILRGQELKELRELIEVVVDFTTTLSRFAPSALLLTRSGVDLACIKTNKPAGVELRRRIVRELFPALREGRLPGFEPEPQPTIDDQRAVELLSTAAQHNAKAADLSEMAVLQLVGEERYRWLRKTLRPSLGAATTSVATRDRTDDAPRGHARHALVLRSQTKGRTPRASKSPPPQPAPIADRPPPTGNVPGTREHVDGHLWLTEIARQLGMLKRDLFPIISELKLRTPAYSRRAWIVLRDGKLGEGDVFNADAVDLIREAVFERNLGARPSTEYTGTRHRPAAVAKQLGITHQKLGRLVSQLGLRGDSKMVVPRKDKGYDLTTAGVAVLCGAVHGGTGTN